jgi:hypothetical protein
MKRNKFLLAFFTSLLLSLSLLIPKIAYPQSASSVIPVSAIAPWAVFRRVDALRYSSTVGLQTVWGDYWEKSENPSNIGYTEQSQELTNTANGNYAVYNNVDLGSGVEALMLRIALASGTNTVEVRLGSASGTVVGTCTVNSTGSVSNYRTVPCPLDTSLAKGKHSLVIRFPGSNSQMRFNWFAFWAKDTTQQIDRIQAVFAEGRNKNANTLPIAGTPIRSQTLLPGSSEILAKPYGIWNPSKVGDCPKWLHDTYWVKADDNKIYPTWHPPVDFNPETNKYCTYGHEHGDDPRASEVFNIGGMPAFGYVNEQLATNNPNNVSVHRHEDHFGHKVRVANNWKMYNPNNGSTILCDAIYKVHMGSHSPDALTNTAHEMLASGKCDGKEPFNLKYFALFGEPGSFKEPETNSCNLYVSSGITPSPTNQPAGGVHRSIPTTGCFKRGTTTEQNTDVDKRTKEFWLTNFAGKDVYLSINNPSRYYDPNSTTKIARTVDLCYDSTHPLSKTLHCQEVLAAGSRVTWDDTRSPFRGTTQIQSHISGLIFPNSSTSVVYTDAYGKNSSSSPDPSRGVTLKQIVPKQGFYFNVDGQDSLFSDIDYSALGKNGVRAPN